MCDNLSGRNPPIYLSNNSPFDRSRYNRAQEHLLPGATESIKLASPEDMVLNKLLWYWQDDIASERQWRDAQSIIRVQGAALDQHYMRTWATALDISALLEAALRGDSPPQMSGDPQQGQLF